MWSWFCCHRVGSLGMLVWLGVFDWNATWGNQILSITSICSRFRRYFSLKNKEINMNNNIPNIQLYNQKPYFWYSHPISGLCSIPRILCNLSMATLCWKLDKPAVIKIHWINVKADRHLGFSLQAWKSECNIYLKRSCFIPLSNLPFLSPCRRSSKGRINRCRLAH